MFASPKEFQIGDVKGVEVYFHRKGHVLRWHTHTEENAHFSIVARGSILIEQKGLPNKIADAGAILDFGTETPHQFTALEDDTKVVNVVKKVV